MPNLLPNSSLHSSFARPELQSHPPAQGTGAPGLSRSPDQICLREYSWPPFDPAHVRARLRVEDRACRMLKSGFQPRAQKRAPDPTAVCFLFDTAPPQISERQITHMSRWFAPFGFRRNAYKDKIRVAGGVSRSRGMQHSPTGPGFELYRALASILMKPLRIMRPIFTASGF